MLFDIRFDVSGRWSREAKTTVALTKEIANIRRPGGKDCQLVGLLNSDPTLAEHAQIRSSGPLRHITDAAALDPAFD